MRSSRPILGELESGARVLFIRLRSMGDCVLTTPALRMLADFRPDLDVAVMVDPQFAGVYEGLASVRRILAPSPKEAFGFHPALTVNLHGGTRSAALTAATRARHRAGFGHFRQQYLYNIAIPRAQEILGEERVVHTAEHVASALFYLGLPLRDIPRADLSAAPAADGRPYAVLHPFASAPEKAWPVEKFVELAAALPFEAVVLAGPADDVSPFSRFRCVVNQPLSTVKTLLRGTSLFVGNDSGPAHIAAAFDVPLVVLFGPSDPAIWAPWRATRAQVLTSARAVAVSGVLEAVEKLGVLTA
jgi:ADP-heptose:LPS heptosyltransferase